MGSCENKGTKSIIIGIQVDFEANTSHDFQKTSSSSSSEMTLKREK